ncbi:MAG TPA: hypothetical protein VG371_05340 [Solirubrobacteraceae bacterium]|nr:hypothetical protein [Solirubrobacteraceae bacterium]
MRLVGPALDQHARRRVVLRTEPPYREEKRAEELQREQWTLRGHRHSFGRRIGDTVNNPANRCEDPVTRGPVPGRTVRRGGVANAVF